MDTAGAKAGPAGMNPLQEFEDELKLFRAEVNSALQCLYTFLALNFVAAGLWSGAVVSAGYAFGQVSEQLMNDASSGLGIVMLIAFLGLSWILSKKLERVAERS